jgi:SRSO17 transposase
LVLGLLSDLPRKNCWTIAEWAGEATPNQRQHPLSRAKWDADQVRDDVRGYVVEHLHDDAAVLVVDETGDVKKGACTVGVRRQHTGTAGRIENAQAAVYLVYAGRRGHAAVDRELYIPRSWTDQPDRCRAAGLTEPAAFATKPELATRMIARFFDTGHHACWVAGDEVYGGNPTLRAALERRSIGELAFYRCFSPTPVPVATLVHAAGSRWRVEETFQASKGLAGLDEHQVRRYVSLALVVQPLHGIAHHLSWSHWRRRHQARSKISHYDRQAAGQA